MVEAWLKSNNLVQTNMWIGLKRNSTVWTLGDGTIAGSGGANITAPVYRKFAATNVATQSTNPTYICGRSTSTGGPRRGGIGFWHAMQTATQHTDPVIRPCCTRVPSLTRARAAGAYTDYVGNSSFAQLRNTSLYISNATTDTNAWLATLCTTTYSYMCEINPIVYACPEAPARPPPPPATGPSCETRTLWCLPGMAAAA
jgi:hypothetical protein